jgi:hypothetical protein
VLLEWFFANKGTSIPFSGIRYVSKESSELPDYHAGNKRRFGGTTEVFTVLHATS